MFARGAWASGISLREKVFLLSLLSGVFSPHAIFSKAWSDESIRQCLHIPHLKFCGPGSLI